MEFFRIVDITTNQYKLQSKINYETLNDYCESLMLTEKLSDHVLVDTMWGEFKFKRDEIKGGLRFALLNCPNALAWTVTTGYPPAEDKIVLHLTINRTEHKENFIEELNELLDQWEIGLKSLGEN